MSNVIWEKRSDIRLGRLVLQISVSQHSASSQSQAALKTYGALLQLAVVARLLHAVEQLLDQRGVLGLGPSSRVVLSRHRVVGVAIEKGRWRGNGNGFSPGFTAVARPGNVVNG